MVSPQSIGGGYTGISISGQWECGACGASGDAWYDPEDGMTLHDENDEPFATDEHECWIS